MGFVETAIVDEVKGGDVVAFPYDHQDHQVEQMGDYKAPNDMEHDI